MNSSVFWCITPCCPWKFNWCFGGCCFLLQGLRISRNKTSACHLLSRWFLARLILLPWRWRRRVLPKRWFTFQGLHDVVPQKVKPSFRSCSFWLSVVRRGSTGALGHLNCLRWSHTYHAITVVALHMLTAAIVVNGFRLLAASLLGYLTVLVGTQI
jgi:hypothetical protein